MSFAVSSTPNIRDGKHAVVRKGQTVLVQVSLGGIASLSCTSFAHVR